MQKVKDFFANLVADFWMSLWLAFVLFSSLIIYVAVLTKEVYNKIKKRLE